MPLATKAFDLLVVLVQRSGRVVGKDELLREVWPDTFVEDGSLAVHIFAIRKALGQAFDGHGYIETAPKRGYRFLAQVRTVSEVPKIILRLGAWKSDRSW